MERSELKCKDSYGHNREFLEVLKQVSLARVEQVLDLLDTELFLEKIFLVTEILRRIITIIYHQFLAYTPT